jgi:3',5'-cyclic AMP phosphodiesterase CpdA
MTIVQMTDLHVVSRERLCLGRVPTNAHLARAVAHINALDPKPEAVIASGDLTDHGSAEEYDMLREILADLIPPVFVIPGNHDRRETLLRAFASEEYMPPPDAPFVQYSIDRFSLRLIGLDTTVPQRDHGMICEERLRWLDNTLQARPDAPTLIFMHHPPFRTGVQWMDAAGLYGGRKMAQVVQRHPQVVRIACGHIHRPIYLAWAGTIVSTSPSTCHQLPLNLTGHGGLEYITEPRAVQLHVWDDSYGLISHLSYIPDGFEQANGLGSLTEEARAAWQAQNHREYQELCETEYERTPETNNG